MEDKSFTNFAQLPYAVKTPILDVGTSVFALGYPMSDILGEEIKVTDGIISSKTGYQGDVVLRWIISMCNSLIISVVILQNTST